MRKLDWFLVAALVALVAWFGIQTNIEDHRLDRLRDNAVTLKAENAELRAKISRIAKLSADLGELLNNDIDGLDARVGDLEIACSDLDARMGDVESILNQYGPSSC